MDILFVYSVHNRRDTVKPLETQWDIHFGISYISSLLRSHGHRTKLLVLNKKNVNMIFDSIKGFCPQVICFTAVATEYPFIAYIAGRVKYRNPHIFLLAGGPHISLNPEDCLADSFDGLCIGEGEQATLELVQQLEKGETPSGIRNLWIKGTDGIERNPTRSFLQELDTLPFPDRKIWQEWIKHPASPPPVLLGRGCPYNCTYCCNHVLRELAQGTYVRLRSHDSIIKEVEEIAEAYPTIKDIYFEVETFGADLHWAVQLCLKLQEFNTRREIPLSFGTNLRVTPNANFESLFFALKECNFAYINIGLESGSERIRREVLNRKESNEDIIHAVRVAKKYGIGVSFYNMVGIPGETEKDFIQTVNMNRMCFPDNHTTSIFYPYSGTKLYSICKEKGLIRKPLNPDWERQKARLDFPGFSRRQIERKYVWFDYYIYKGHKPIAEIMANVLGRKLSQSPLLERLYNFTNYHYAKGIKNLLKDLLVRLI